METPVEVVVSGHLCVDLIPEMSAVPPAALISPGKLFEIGALRISTGGAVSNTGLALHRLGINVRLMATIGDDLVGQLILAALKDTDPSLVRFIAVSPGQKTSYSVLLSPQRTDRIILHYTGTNEHLSPEDFDDRLIRQAKIFHLGYPPLLPRLLAEDGLGLAEVFRRATSGGVITSMDTALPDPNRPSLNWTSILARVLPHVDIFVPSIEEILFMLRRRDYDAWHGDVLPHLSSPYLRDLAGELLDMGTTITGFKLGDMGLYLCSGNSEKLSRIQQWENIELWHPAFEVNVVGTTGAGDSAYAGLIAALVKGLSPSEAIKTACAVGACNVEAADAVSGIRSWEETQARLAAGWATSAKCPTGF